MTSLADRILGALALQPMTVDQLSRCLSCSRSAVRRWLRAMRQESVVRCNGRQQGKNGRPWDRYEVMA